MSHPLRVQRKGMRDPLNGAVLVTRGTRWGNPFRIEHYGRTEALRRYEHEHLPAHPELLAQLPDLRGKRLACYCPLDEPCHADILARLANEGAQAPPATAGRMVTSSPSSTPVSRPSRKRMSSPPT